MPRAARLDAPLAWHHVWARGIERRAIFVDVTDRLDFVARLAQLVYAGCLAVHAWALMPNHFHFLLRTGNRGLSASMRILLGGYATAFNLRHQRAGHLFQNRFKSTLVEHEAYFLELLRYIHLNPLRANIVPSLDALEHYRWTGHASLLGNHPWPWHDCEFVLAEFASTRRQARRKYREFFAAGVGRTAPDLDGGGLRRSRAIWEHYHPLRRGREAWSFDERVLGGGQFVRKILEQLNAAPARSAHRLDASRIVHHLLTELSRLTGRSARELVSNSKRTEVVECDRHSAT